MSRLDNRLRALPITVLLTALACLYTAVAAQEPAPVEHATPASAEAKPATDTVNAPAAQVPAISEDELRQMLVGKTFYLRNGYLDNSLGFDEHGKLAGHSPQGSYTLCLIQIDKVHVSKHKVELTGTRFGLHFLGALPKEDPTKAIDRVRITPKKKFVRITIDRELVVTPKKKKDKSGKNAKAATPAVGATKPVDANDADDEAAARNAMAAAPPEERPANAAGVTTTTSQAHANQLLRTAIDTIFAPSLDERMIAALPDFWKLYYQAAAAQADYAPSQPGVLRQTDVDQKAKLLSTFEPPSNEYAQTGGVAGMALYHAVIGPDGKPQEIVVGRPIGFGLDENAADTIRKASFQPALKDGKPVAVSIDLVVQFRIYSKRTNQPAKPGTDEANTAPKLPGPYSVTHP